MILAASNRLAPERLRPVETQVKRAAARPMAARRPHAQIARMRRFPLILLLVAAACRGDRNPENSAVCGFAALAAGTMILEQFQGRTTVMATIPADLAGTVRTRVVGYGTARALVARSDSSVTLGYEGEGFPERPGFAVALVDDSSEVFRGVLVYDSDGPVDYPQIGTISSATSTIPLYAMRITWSRVSNPRCPLFAAPDTAAP